MSVIYLISVLLLIILDVLIKKKEDKIEILREIAIKIVLFLCYQIFICLIFTAIRIPITLGTLTIVNSIIIVLQIFAIKKKKIQKYYFDKKDVIIISVLILLTIVLARINYGLPFNIKYMMGSILKDKNLFIVLFVFIIQYFDCINFFVIMLFSFFI